MDAIRKIVLIACLLAIAISILDILYPSKKFEKQVHLIFSLIFIIGVSVPILSGSIKINIPSADSIEISQAYLDLQDNVNAKYKSTIEENINKSLTSKLTQNQIDVKEISTKVNIADDNSISISKVNIVCNSTDEDEKIVTLIKSEVGQEVNIVLNQGSK